MQEGLQKHFKAVIVGAGPIGAALALLLARIDEKQTILLLDAAAVPPAVDPEKPDARIFAVNEGTGALLERLGVWSEISIQRCQAYNRMCVWDAQGTGSISFGADDIGADQLGHIVEANVILSCLLAAIEKQPNIELLRSEKVSEFLQTEEHTEITLDSGRRIDAELVCAADGAKSALRSMANIDVAENDVEQKAIVANLFHERPNQACAWQIFHPTGPLAFLPLADIDGRHMSSIVWSLDTREADRVMALSDKDFEKALRYAIEEKFGALSLGSERFSFPLVQRHAKDYVQPAFALIGDAAHSIHPLAGLGANIGFQDVVALSKELERASRRGIAWGNLQVLKRYQRARRIDNELVLNAMNGFKQFFGNTHPVIAAIRNLGLSGISALPLIKHRLAEQAMMKS